MIDATGINFAAMNFDLRVALTDAFMGEAIEMEHDESERIAGLQALLRVPNGEPVGDTGDDQTPDDMASDAVLVARMIGFHFGNI